MRLVDADALKVEIERRRKAAKTLTGVDMVRLINDQPEVITRCCECKNWEQVGGLTCGACMQYGAFTTQYEFCSRGRKHGKVD